MREGMRTIPIRDAIHAAIDSRRCGEIRHFIHARLGEPAKEIVELADEENADLIVVATHGYHGIRRLWHACVSEHVVRDAHCPVLVMRPKLAELDFHRFDPEPPCSRCVDRRDETAGTEMWCDDHARPHEDAHTYGGGSAWRGSQGALDAWSKYNH